MKIFIDDEVIEEIKIADVVKSADNGRVIKSETGNGSKVKRSEEQKVIVGIDANELGVSEASKIHGVPVQTVSSYKNGDKMDEDSRDKVLAVKHNIADLATAKLMSALNLFDPEGIEKQKDLVDAAGKLAGIVRNLSDNSKNGNNAVVVNFYSPKQKQLSDYEVIDVK